MCAFDPKEYKELLRILLKVAEVAGRGVENLPEQDQTAGALAAKFIYHACTALFLYEHRTKLGDVTPGGDTHFTDLASINALGRAAIEAVLVFNHIFVKATTPDEMEFRYLAWKLHSLRKAQRATPLSDKSREMMKRVDEVAGECLEKLRSNASFQSLGRREQESIEEGGRRTRWRTVAEDSELSELHSKDFYQYLCDYVHSNYRSVDQMVASRSEERRRESCLATLESVMIATAFLIQSYVKRYDVDEAVLSLEQRDMVRLYAELGRASFEHVDLDDDD